MDTPQTPPSVDDNSLDKQDTVVSSENTAQDKKNKQALQGGFFTRIVKKLSFLNIYLLLFLFIVVLAIIITFISIQNNRNSDKKGVISAQNLTNDSLNTLSDNNTVIGNSKQTLTVASNSTFNGKVLFKDSIDVAGTIRIGGSLSLPGLTVSGTSSFENVQVGNAITIGNDANINGNLNVLKSLSVSGGASFGGAISAAQLNIDRLTLNQDLVLNRHIRTSGGTPGVDNGTAVGGGGTTSINGSDTSGTITLNIGAAPAAGVLATVTFVNSFAGDPHVVVTPVGSSAAALDWYISRDSQGFSVSTITPPTSGTSFSFDYIVMN